MFRENVDISKALLARDTNDLQMLFDLADDYNKVGLVLQRLGEFDEAREHFESDLEIKQRLVARDSVNVRWWRFLGTAHGFLGHLFLAMGDADAALRHFEDGITIARRLVTTDSSNAQWRRGAAAAPIVACRDHPPEVGSGKLRQPPDRRSGSAPSR